MAFAATYYVDATGGSDTNNGTATTRAWKTLARVSSANLVSGDSVLFKRGGLWRGQLNIVRSGASTNPIRFGAYDSGPAPVFNGADIAGGWTAAANNLYTVSQSTDPDIVVFNGVKGTRAEALTDVDAAGDWFWANNTLTVFSDAAPVNMEVASRHFVIAGHNISHVEIKDITVKYGIDAICLSDTNYVLLDNVTVYDGAGMGAIIVISYTAGRGEFNTVQNCSIYNISGSTESMQSGNNGCGIVLYGEMCKNNTVSGCMAHHCGHEGVFILGGSNNRIAGSTVYQCGQAGLRVALETATGNIIEGNHSYENGQDVDDRFGIDLIRVGNDNVVRYNVVHDQHDTLNDPGIPGNKGNPKYGTGGIRFDGGDWEGNDYMASTGNQAYYNVIYNETTGIESFNFSNISFHNNVVYNSTVNGIAFVSASTPISTNNVARNNIVYAGAGAVFTRYRALQNTIDYNVYFSAGTTRFSWDGVFGNFSFWKTQSQQDTHSQVTNPLWVDVAAHDFHLQAASPCIDAGLDVGLTRDHDGTLTPQQAGVDVGAFELPLTSITVGMPNGGESYFAGQDVPVQWSYTGSPGAEIKIELLDGGVPFTLAENIPVGLNGSGSWTWALPAGQAPGADFLLRVSSTSLAACADTSDGVFAIVIHPPEIAEVLVEPEPAKALVGDSLRLTVRLASGTPPFAYQWYKDGSPMTGETADNCLISDAQLEDAGDYACEVSNAAGADMSEAVTIQVIEPLTIVRPPQGMEHGVGDDCLLTVETSGGLAPLAYQWYRTDGAEILSDAPVLEMPNLQLDDSGDYYVIVVDGTSTVRQSASATITVRQNVPASSVAGLLLAGLAVAVVGLRVLRISRPGIT
jgi:parallel beta-helix repeat protein